MDLLALTAFQQIVAHGGIGPASRAVGIPKTTLSRRLRQLEAGLGTRLVERGPRLFRLTDEGLALHERTHVLLAEIDEVGQALAGGLARPRGRLRVSAPPLFTDLHMGPIAAAFAERFPEILLELVSENRLVDPLREGIDVVVRVNPGIEEEMVGRLLYREDTLLVASTLCPPEESGETSVPAVMLPTTGTEQYWAVEAPSGHRVFVPRPVLRINSILAARQAVLAGAGAALLPRSAIAEDLTAGRLICWGRLPERPVELRALYRSRRLRSPKVAAFIDFLAEAFAGNR